jgi:DNA-binding NtrC family response regulator
MSKLSKAPRVLVAEDDPLLRMLLAQALEVAGFEVTEAADADQALELLSLRERKLAALVTDIDMPGALNGCGLAWRVHELHPEAAIVVVSGVATPGRGELPAKAKFIAKPVPPDRLAEMLTDTLQSDTNG